MKCRRASVKGNKPDRTGPNRTEHILRYIAIYSIGPGAKPRNEPFYLRLNCLVTISSTTATHGARSARPFTCASMRMGRLLPPWISFVQDMHRLHITVCWGGWGSSKAVYRNWGAGWRLPTRRTDRGPWWANWRVSVIGARLLLWREQRPTMQ